ncbi:hypothetical protein [Natrinema amylolyticum]|uniref:hypothetical protein n=1 Tax=Natrinema amylolyticum TaxID=2878679 RepID=UPI001CFB5C1A|nr:hypothetical protein [Natrinema amylolyticum]
MTHEQYTLHRHIALESVLAGSSAALSGYTPSSDSGGSRGDAIQSSAVAKLAPAIDYPDRMIPYLERDAEACNIETEEAA